MQQSVVGRRSLWRDRRGGLEQKQRDTGHAATPMER